MTRLYRLSAVLALLCFPLVAVSDAQVSPTQQKIADVMLRLDRVQSHLRTLTRELDALETVIDDLAKATEETR